jgi:hypothetical protein
MKVQNEEKEKKLGKADMLSCGLRHKNIPVGSSEPAEQKISLKTVQSFV